MTSQVSLGDIFLFNSCSRFHYYFEILTLPSLASKRHLIIVEERNSEVLRLYIYIYIYISTFRFTFLPIEVGAGIYKKGNGKHKNHCKVLSSINKEVIRPVLNLFFFFYDKISALKTQSIYYFFSR